MSVIEGRRKRYESSEDQKMNLLIVELVTLCCNFKPRFRMGKTLNLQCEAKSVERAKMTVLDTAIEAAFLPIPRNSRPKKVSIALL